VWWGARARPPGHGRCFPLRWAVYSGFNKLRKAEAAGGRHHGPSQLAWQSGEGVPFTAPMPPSRTLCPHETRIPKAHPPTALLGGLTQHRTPRAGGDPISQQLRNDSSVKQLSHRLPPAQRPWDGGHSPPRSQPHGPSPARTASTPCQASCQRSRGRSDTRSSSSSRGAPARWAPWQRCGRCPSRCGCCFARGRMPGAASERKRQLKAKGERLSGVA